MEWILERGNGEYVGRRDLISESVTIYILECGSVRPSATLLYVGIGDIEIVQVRCVEVSERVETVRRDA